MASSNWKFPLYWPFVRGNHRWIPPQRPVTWSIDFSLICAWTNGGVNNRDAGDLRRQVAHYDVIVLPSNTADLNAPPYGISLSLYLRFHIDVLVQEIRNSSALAMYLRLSCTNPSIWTSIWKCTMWFHMEFYSNHHCTKYPQCTSYENSYEVIVGNFARVHTLWEVFTGVKQCIFQWLFSNELVQK